MTTRRTARGQDRLQFHEGALLAASDLRDDVAYESRMRGLHTRVMHNTWGVARGFAVHLNQGRDTVLVSPGIAYDCAGREIVSSRSLALNPPQRPLLNSENADAWWFDLVISYDEALAACGRLTGCDDTGNLRTEERPRWRWVYAGAIGAARIPPPLADDVRLGEEIPLARIVLLPNGTVGAIDFSHRRHAQGLVRPHIGTGTVAAGSTNVYGHFNSWTVDIDTTSAGFSQTPFYFANIDGQWLNEISTEGDLGVEMARIIRRVLGPFVSIEAATRTSFKLRVRFGVVPQDTNDDPVRSIFYERSNLQTRQFIVRVPLPFGINWVGVEPVEGCHPPISFSTIRWLSGQSFIEPEFAFRNLALHNQAFFDSPGEGDGDD